MKKQKNKKKHISDSNDTETNTWYSVLCRCGKPRENFQRTAALPLSMSKHRRSSAVPDSQPLTCPLEEQHGEPRPLSFTVAVPPRCLGVLPRSGGLHFWRKSYDTPDSHSTLSSLLIMPPSSSTAPVPPSSSPASLVAAPTA